MIIVDNDHLLLKLTIIIVILKAVYFFTVYVALNSYLFPCWYTMQLRHTHKCRIFYLRYHTVYHCYDVIVVLTLCCVVSVSCYTMYHAAIVVAYFDFYRIVILKVKLKSIHIYSPMDKNSVKWIQSIVVFVLINSLTYEISEHLAC